MDQRDDEAEGQHPHRLIQRCEPQRLQTEVRSLSKEILADHADRVSEEGAKHESPEGRGNPAQEEHAHRLLHALFHRLPELEQDESGCKEHQNSVSCVRKHDAEQDVVEERGQKRRVNLFLSRKRIALRDAFQRFGKAIVFQQDGRGFLCSRIHDLYGRVKPAFDVSRYLLRFWRRNESFQKEYPSRLKKLRDHTVLLRPGRIIVGREPDVLP